MSEHHKQVTTEAAAALLKWIENMRAEFYAKSFPNLTPEPMTMEWGRKNIKVLCGHSACAFIEIATGKIMKAASYKAPDPKRYERGNANDPESWPKWLTSYGPQYLR